MRSQAYSLRSANRPVVCGKGDSFFTQLPRQDRRQRATYRLPVLRSFNHFLKLRPEHIDCSLRLGTATATGEIRRSIRANKVATERDVKPVALLAFDDKVTPSKIQRAGFVFSSLSNHVDKQVPRACLS